MKRIKGFCVACLFAVALLSAPIQVASAQGQQAPLSPQLKQALAGAQTPADVQNIMNQYNAQNGGATGTQGVTGELAKIGTAAQTGNASALGNNALANDVVSIIAQLIQSLLDKVMNGTATPADQQQLAGLQQASDAIQSNQDQGNPPTATTPAPGTTGSAPGTTGTTTGTPGSSTGPATGTTTGAGTATGAGAGATGTGAGATGAGATGAGATGAGSGATGPSATDGATAGAANGTSGTSPGGTPTGTAGTPTGGGGVGGGTNPDGSPAGGGPGGGAPGAGAAGGPGGVGGTKGGSKADDLAGKLETLKGRLVIFPKPKLGAKADKVDDAAKRLAKTPSADAKAGGGDRLAKLRAKLKHDELGEGLLKVEATIIEWKRIDKELASGRAPSNADQKSEKDEFAEVRNAAGKIDFSKCEMWLVDYRRAEPKRYRLTFTADQLDQIEPVLGAQLAVKGSPTKVDELPKGIEEDLPGEVSRLDVVNIVGFVKDANPVPSSDEPSSASKKPAVDTTPRKPAVSGDTKKSDPTAPATPKKPKEDGNEFDD